MKDHAGACPPVEDLSALVDGALPARDAQELARHAARCPACGATVEAFGRVRAQLRPLRARAPDVDIAALVLPRLPRWPDRPRARHAAPGWRDLWQFGPRALGGAAALGAGVYLGLALLAGSAGAVRPSGMTVFDAEPVGALCAGLPSCAARGR